jgi:ferredoxin-NADP reductase
MINAPRNLFEIDNTAIRHVLLAGGIGITPLYEMFNYLGPVHTKESINDEREVDEER